VVFEEKESAPKVKKEAGPDTCPLCAQGKVMKGKSAFGCSNWKSGCTLRIPIEFLGKSLSESQVSSLIRKGETAMIKGLVIGGKKVDGKIKWDAASGLRLS
jgi:DNA topoisomerase-3